MDTMKCKDCGERLDACEFSNVGTEKRPHFVCGDCRADNYYTFNDENVYGSPDIGLHD